MDNRDILISGASVAGPALAFWLSRHGFRPTVVERAPAPRTGGQAVDLRGAARQVVERMGLLDAIRALHTGTRGAAFVNEAGRRVATLPEMGDSGGVIAEIEILRSDLVRILIEATRGYVEYVYSDSITSLQQGEHGVDVTFERGAPRSFALVVGADGLHSNVRALAFGPEPEFVHPHGYSFAIFGMPDPIGLDGWELMLTPPPGRMVMLYPLSRTGAARAIFYYASQSNGTDRLDTRQQKQVVADRFADVGWVVPRMLDAMWDAEDFYTDRPAKVAIDRWSSGRAVLVGDSAFAGSVGMGTSLALVGACVLASELAASGVDHRRAFARYEQAMRPFVERNVKPLPGGLRAFLPPTRFDVFMRNLFLRVIPHLPMKGMMSVDIQDAASAITLDESPKAMASMPLGTTAIESGGIVNVTAGSASRV